LDAGLFHHIACATADMNGRRAVSIVADFDVAPGDSAAPAGAKRLEDRFLGGPAARIMLRRRLAV
jgi:hypothetical protein